MRILYVDIDTLRADHLGCYGYGRDTSPQIDELAKDGVRFERCYASDVPCLPSRSALATGRFGIHNGVVGHGGSAADPFPDGAERGFWSSHGRSSFAGQLRKAGLHTATLSSFADRHSAYQWYAGFSEHNMVPKLGLEQADEVFELTRDWLQRNGERDDWFLHVHLWDPHTPYRVPADYGDPFADAPLPGWLTEDVRAGHWTRPGPHSAQECVGFSPDYPWGDYPRQPERIPDMGGVRAMFDGSDTGVRFADDAVGRMLNVLADLGVLDETAIMVSADHGETLGELNIYCDHHTADEQTARVPMILRWPGAPGGRVERGLHYQFDVSATLLELLGGEVPALWDGRSTADAFAKGEDAGREFLVLSQGAWTCQRSVRFEDYLCMRTYHDGYHA
ncbi:MAG: sulfatase, partial [Candidatus Devosia euplotis]|nr:sulfatase [Candidatus Devosia euplotis]